MDSLIRRFPEMFETKCNFCSNSGKCQSRIAFTVGGEARYGCSYAQSFWFENLTMRDIRDILSVFKSENGIV